MAREWSLAELAELAGVPARTIRFYISRGLLPRPAGGGRAAVYTPEHRERLDAIRKLQARGMMLHDIARELGSERRPALPQPASWWQYPVADGVTVSVRTDQAPWRLRRIQDALAEFTARLARDTAEEEDEHGGKRFCGGGGDDGR